MFKGLFRVSKLDVGILGLLVAVSFVQQWPYWWAIIHTALVVVLCKRMYLWQLFPLALVAFHYTAIKVIAIVASGAALALFPVPWFIPALRRTVGRRRVDVHRDGRCLAVVMWYPAASSSEKSQGSSASTGNNNYLSSKKKSCCSNNTKNAALWGGGRFPAIASAMVDVLPAAPNFFSMFVGHVARPMDRVFDDAELDMSSTSSVVFFSHGLAGIIAQNEFLCLLLASHGYVVIAVGHPGDAAVLMTNSGSVSTFTVGRPKLWGKLSEEDRKKEYDRWVQHLDTRYQDNIHVMSELKKIIPELIPSFAKGVGIFGHSYGGATSILLAARHPETYRAVVSLDSWLFALPPELKGQGTAALHVPLLQISSSEWQWEVNMRRINRLHRDSSSNLLQKSDEQRCFNMTMIGSSHHNFNDAAFWMPWIGHKISMLGSQPNPGRASLEMNDAIVSFFNEHLRGIRPSPRQYKYIKENERKPP